MQMTEEVLKKIKQEAYRKGYADGKHDGYNSTLIEDGAEELYYDDENILVDIEEHIEDIPDELVKLFVKVFAKTDGWENITIKDFLDVIEKNCTN